MVPIGPGERSADALHLFSILSPLNPKKDAMVRPHFPLDLAFAMTVNKAEGQTLPNVILCLSERAKKNFDHKGLYVSFSRVKQSENIRLFTSGFTDETRKQSLAYLKNLQPDPATKAFFEGFAGEHWLSENWFSRTFDRDRAARAFCQLKEDDFRQRQHTRNSKRLSQSRAPYILA